MTSKIFTYHIDDGYAGPARPHEVEVLEEDILACDCQEAVKRLLEEIMQDDFESTIYPFEDKKSVEEILKFWRENQGGPEAA